MRWFGRASERPHDRGTTSVEYGIIIAGVAVVAIPAILFLQNSAKSTYSATTDAEVGVCVGSCPASAEVPPPSGFSDTPGNGGPQDQTVDPVSFSPSSGAEVGGSATVAAAATSGLAVTFTSGTPAACTVSGSSVLYVGDGTCTINANQAGNASWNPAQSSGSISVAPAPSPQDQTVTVSFSPSSGAKVGGSATVTAAATSGLAVTFTSGTPAVCTISGADVSYAAVGTCTITASQAGNTNWKPAQGSGSILVAKGDQAIGPVSFSPSSGAVVPGPATVSATATSGLQVTFTSGTQAVCTISGADVTYVAVGTCTITANQAGNGTWNSATPVSGSIAVSKGNQTITFTSLPATGTQSKPGNKSTLTLSATSTSTLPVTFVASPSNLCQMENDGVTLWLKNSTGTCTVTSSQGGNTNWNAAPSVIRTIVVS